MESHADRSASEPSPYSKHIKIKSKKYGRTYEVFGSEIFMKGIDVINNRLLTTLLKKLTTITTDRNENKTAPSDWLVIKQMSNSLTDEERKEACIQSQNKLIESIKASEMIVDFDQQLIF